MFNLTLNGIDYFEDWIQSFESLTEQETENQELPQPIFDFFKFSSKTTTVLSFFTQILKLAERF